MHIPVISVLKYNKVGFLHAEKLACPGVFEDEAEGRQAGADYVNAYLADLMPTAWSVQTGTKTYLGQTCVFTMVEFEEAIIEIRLVVFSG